MPGALEQVEWFGVSGWARHGAVVQVAGQTVVADLPRADLPPWAAGFAAWFDTPLTGPARMSATVAGRHLPGSPLDYHPPPAVPAARAPDAGTPLALVVDPALPDPSRDAASAALLSHMAALRTLGFAVRFATPDAVPWDAIAGRVRVAYLHRMASMALARRLRAGNPGVHVVFAVADVAHLRAARQAAVLGGTAPPGLRAMELVACRMADAVLTHSPVEAALLRASLPGLRVHVVPWHAAARPVAMPFAARSGVGFVGSYGHAPNPDAARFLLDAVMPEVWRHAPVPVVLAGHGLPAWLAARAAPLVRVLPKLDDVGDLWRQVRLGVAPLRFGAGVKGKVIDCLAAGLACACTPVAAEGLDVPPGWIGHDAAGLAARILALHAAPPATLPRLAGAAAVAAALAAAVATARLDRPAG